MFNDTTLSVDLVVPAEVEEYEIEGLARSQIKDGWGDVMYKLRGVHLIQEGRIPAYVNGGQDVAEVDARIYLVYFNLLQ